MGAAANLLTMSPIKHSLSLVLERSSVRSKFLTKLLGATHEPGDRLTTRLRIQRVGLCLAEGVCIRFYIFRPKHFSQLTGLKNVKLDIEQVNYLLSAQLTATP